MTAGPQNQVSMGSVFLKALEKIYSRYKAIEKNLIRINILSVYTKINSHTLEVRGKNQAR